jgi:hypothetical protein
MKKLLLSIGLFSIASMTFAQGTKISLNPRASGVEKKKLGSSTKAVAGSLVCNTNYVAGTTMDLSFTLELTNTDDEFCDLFTLTFPAGITPNSSPSNPLVTPAIAPQATGTQLNPISGQTISWGTDDDAQYGGIAPGAPINFTVNVTIAANVTGNQVASFLADGDTWGASPADLAGTVTIYPQGAVLPNIDVFAVRTLANQNLDRKCSLAQDTIYAVLTNLGNTTESNLNINFEVNGQSIGQSPAFTLLGSFDIAPGDTAYAIMPFDFTGEGIKNMRAWSSVAGDVALSNDTIAEFFVNTLPTTLSNTNYTNGIENDFELNSLLSTWNGLGIGFGPSTGTVHTGTQALFYTVNTNIGAPAGDYETYLVLPCIDVVQGETYKISYWRKSNTNTNPASINGSTAIFVGQGEDIASLTDTLKPYSAITPNAQAGPWQKDSVEYVADVCGTVYFAIGAKGTVATGVGVNVRIDDILVEKTETLSSFSQEACDSYNWNGVVYTQTGQYTQTLPGVNCDSTVTLNLTIYNSSSTSFDVIACDSYEWNNNIYTTTGVYIDTFSTVQGCDSIETLNLTINYSSSSFVSDVACSSYIWNGSVYDASGIYTFTTQNSSGCDSVVTLELTINQPSFSSTTQTACDSYFWNGVVYTNSGTYFANLTNVFGCDSTATLDLIINNSVITTIDSTVCFNLLWNGIDLTSTGIYYDTLVAANSCDSIIELYLTVNDGISSSVEQTSCDFYIWNGNLYDTSGIYIVTDDCVVGANDTLILTINNSVNDILNITACSSYDWNGTTYTSSGTYDYFGQTIAGCDSTVVLNLTINQPNSSTINEIACGSYAWNGQNYTLSGVYTDTLLNSAGCDSVATLILTINQLSTSTSTQSACGSYTWNGQTYNQSGTYTFSTLNAVGCDSTATLVLTINTVTATATLGSTGNTISASAGSSYQWINCTGNTPISGATNQTFTPTANGSYAVIVTSNNCSDTSNCVTVSGVGIQETDLASIIVKPNPSTGIFQLTSDQFLNGDLVITDATGRIVSKEKLSQVMTIDITDVSQGIYYFNVITLDSNRVIRVIKN